MRRRAGFARSGAAFASSLLLAACTGVPAGSPTPTTPISSSPAPTLIADASPGPTETAVASPSQPPAAGGWRVVTGQESASNAQFQDVVWTRERFVAVGLGLDEQGGVFASSEDGQRWSSVGSGAGSVPMTLAVGAGGVVALGSIEGQSAAWRSEDGIDWTYQTQVVPRSLDGTGVVEVTDVVAAGSGWLAVGRDDPPCQINCGFDPNRALAWTSPDGQVWTQVPEQPSMADAAMNAVTAFEDGFVAVGTGIGGLVLWTSPDGRTWTRVPRDPMFGPPPGSDPAATVAGVDIAARDGLFVAVGMAFFAGSDGAPVVMAWKSSDGRTWMRATVARGEAGQVFSVAATTTRFLAVGPSGATSCLGGIWASVDGAAWTCEASAAEFEGFGPYAAAGSPSVEVAVGLTDVGWDPDAGSGLPGAIWWRPIP